MTKEELLQIERQIIHLMLVYKDAAAEVANTAIEPSHFDESHQLLVEAIFESESKNVLLTLHSLTVFLDTRRIAKVQQIGTRAVFNQCRNNVFHMKRDDLPALLQRMRVAWVESQSVKLLEKFHTNKKTDVIFATKQFVDDMKAVLDSSEHDHKVSFNDIMSDEFYNQWEEELQVKRTSDKPILDCGLPEIDDVMGVGFDPETLTLLCADVGGFKSTLMLNIALNIWKRHNKDVLFIGLEMPKNRLFDKIISREARIPFDFLQKPRNVFTDEHMEKIREVRTRLNGGDEENKGRFVLLEFGERTTVAQIRAQIERHVTHFQPSVVVIDYIGNLEPDKARRDRNDLEIGDMLKALLKAGKPGNVTPHGFGIVTGAQTGREALKRIRNLKGDSTKYQFASEDVQGSHQYSADASSIFFLYPDPTNVNRLFIFPAKNRYGKKVYKDGSNKAALKVIPEINLIESYQEVTWQSNADDAFLEKGITPPKIEQDHWEDMDLEEPVGIAVSTEVDDFLSQCDSNAK